MSGAEALLVLGTIANVFAVMDLSSNAIERVKESLEDTLDLPKSFQRLQNFLPLMSDTLHKTEQKAIAGELEESTCKAIQLVIRDSGRELEDLKGILKKLVSPEGASKWRRGMNAMSSLRYDKKAEGIVKALESSMSLLTHYHVATAPTAAQLTSMVTRTSSAATKAVPEPPSIPKPYYMVPIQWSSDFTGRVEIMETLDGKLCQTDRHSRVALVGLGGVGKTRIALQFASRFRHSKDMSVFWMYAGSSERLRKSCFDIAKKANVVGWNDPKIEIFQLVKEWFEGDESGRWLLIVDNADDMEMLYGSGTSNSARYFPRSDRGSILMTTRYRKVGLNFAAIRDAISIPVMSSAEAAQLLNFRLGDTISVDDDLQQLAEELENVPLAMVQASSFITANEIPVKRYLQLYRSSEVSKICMLSEDFEDDIRDSGMRNPVAATWAISFEYLREHESPAADILSLMSMFDSQAIPTSLLSVTDDDLILVKALGTLKAFSMITLRNSESSSAHKQERSWDLRRLVRLAMRSWLRMQTSLNTWALRAIHLLESKYAEGFEETRATWIRYLPHAMVLASYDLLQAKQNSSAISPSCHRQEPNLDQASEDQIHLSRTAPFLLSVARSLGTNGDTELQKVFALRASVISQRVLGDLHAITRDIRAYTALILKKSGDYPGAEIIYRQIIDVDHAIHGHDHPTTLHDTSDLAVTLGHLHLFSESETLLNEVFTRGTEVLGAKHPETLLAMSRLALIYTESGREEDAYALALKVKNLCGEVNDHKDYLMCQILECLASTFARLKRVDESEKAIVQWCTTTRNHLGDTHSETLQAMTVLSTAYQQQQRWDEAEKLQIEILVKRVEVYGREHLHVNYEISQLIVMCLDRAHFVDPEELCKAFLECSKNTLLCVNAQCIDSSATSNEAEAYHCETDTNTLRKFNTHEISKLFREMLVLVQGILGEAIIPAHVARFSRCATAFAHQAQNRLAEAAAQIALSISIGLPGDQAPLTLQVMIVLTNSIAEQGRTAEAFRIAQSIHA